MRFTFILLISICANSIIASANTPSSSHLRVVTSLHPIKLITDEIMHGSGSSVALIPLTDSPHHFQLRPSQMRTATKADLLIWVSNDFETGLNRVRKILPASSHQLQLSASLPAELLIGSKDSHDEHRDIDGHIWLSPELIIVSSHIIAEKLSQLDPENAANYQLNTQRLISRIQQWKPQSQKRLAKDNLSPEYYLEHKFLAYFEQSFQLKHLGSLHNQHDHGSRIRSLSTLHQQLQNGSQDTTNQCLIVTQLPASSQALQLQKQYGLKLKVVNIQGEQSHKDIIQLLDSIVNSLSDCHQANANR